ncbi:hypothetical protein V2J09_015201 [Rumex salicifolius]
MATTTLLLMIVSATTIITTVIAKPEPPTHNITAILSTYPQFATFNHHLTSTGLADVINNHSDITICAVDNSAMSELLSFNPSPCSSSPREVLDLRGSSTSVSFAATYTDHHARFLGFIHSSLPSSLAVIHVSTMLPSPAAESLWRPIDLREVIAGVGCGLFAKALAEVPEAERWYREYVYAGMTVVCPIDDAFEGHVSRFGALREEEKISLFLYHAVPDIYYKKHQMGDSDDPETLLRYYSAAAATTVDMEAVERAVVDGSAYLRPPLAVYPIKGMLFPGHRAPVLLPPSYLEFPIKGMLFSGHRETKTTEVGSVKLLFLVKLVFEFVVVVSLSVTFARVR